MMLRTAILFVATLCLVVALFVAGSLFERFHYRGSDELGGNWQPTSERFLDERSGRPVTVWFNPRTGARRYVEATDKP